MSPGVSHGRITHRGWFMICKGSSISECVPASRKEYLGIVGGRYWRDSKMHDFICENAMC